MRLLLLPEHKKSLPKSGMHRINICRGYLFRGEVMDMHKRELSDNELEMVAGGTNEPEIVNN